MAPVGLGLAVLASAALVRPAGLPLRSHGACTGRPPLVATTPRYRAPPPVGWPAEADEPTPTPAEPADAPDDAKEADASEAAGTEPAPGSVAFRTAALIAARAKKARRLAEERRKARDSALIELRTATRVDIDSLRALRASANLVLAGAEPESTAPQPVDANADQRITIEEIMGALHQDRRGLRKMLDEWQNGEAEGADGLGLRSHSSVRKGTLEKIEKLRKEPLPKRRKSVVPS